MKIYRLLLGISASLFLAPATSAMAEPPIPMSGAYVGAGNPTALSTFASWRGASAPLVVDYLDRHVWTDITDPTWLLSQWRTFTANGGTLVLSVPLLPESGGTLAQGATGQFNGYFKTLAQKLVASGDASAIIRLGWEFNGTWFPWGLQPNSTTASPSDFVEYWQHVVTTMRSVPGAKFKFDWTVNNGSSAVPTTQAYPGNAYVDYIGVDAYDEGWADNGGPIAEPVARWQQVDNTSDGLDFWAAFARQHGKPIAVPEWGLVTNTANGGSDDPYYIEMMYAWLKQNDVAYESYFNAGGSVINGGAAPNAAAEYVHLWGAPAVPTSTGTPRTGSQAPIGTVASGHAPSRATPVVPTPSVKSRPHSATARHRTKRKRRRGHVARRIRGRRQTSVRSRLHAQTRKAAPKPA